MHPRTVGRLCQSPGDSRLAFHRMEPPGCERHRRAAREGERAGANESNALQRPRHARAFTLIELLVVIAIIAILVGLLFPAFKAVQNQARQTQAKNDLTQIVNAVNAYYTEYGQYPLGITADTTYGPGGTPATNETLFRELRGCTAATGSCPGAATTNRAPNRFHFPTRRQGLRKPAIRYRNRPCRQLRPILRSMGHALSRPDRWRLQQCSCQIRILPTLELTVCPLA